MIIIVDTVGDAGVTTKVFGLTRELICRANIVARKLRHQFKVGEAVVEEPSAVGGERDNEEGELLKTTVTVHALHDFVYSVIERLFFGLARYQVLLH